jgi:gamma-butyrobetaine dioxygenase
MNIAIETPFDPPCAQNQAKLCNCGGNCRCVKPADTPVDMADLRSYARTANILAARADESVVTITWSDGSADQYHHGWLRENAPGPESRHPNSRERTVRPLDIREAIFPVYVNIHPTGALSVTWSEQDGNHESLYDVAWLHAHRYSQTPNTAVAAKSRPDRPAPALAEWDDLMTSHDALRLWLDAYLVAGWSIVSGVPSQEGSAITLGQRIGTVRSSNFGFIFDVKSKAEPISNAYTAGFLPLHTDLPHYELPPGLQILHCLQNEAEGGESLLADGLAVAELLAREEPAIFDLLAHTTVPYRFQDADSDYNTRHPIIECNAAGQPVYINWSNSTIAPLDIPFAQMQALRSAIRRFVTLTESPRFIIERKLLAGEALVFDNRRMLHGRTAFLPETGARHLQGCYLDTSEVLSRHEVLTRRNTNAFIA